MECLCSDKEKESKPASKEPAETGQRGNENSCRNQNVNIGRFNVFNAQYYRVIGPTTPTEKVELPVSHCEYAAHTQLHGDTTLPKNCH